MEIRLAHSQRIEQKLDQKVEIQAKISQQQKLALRTLLRALDEERNPEGTDSSRIGRALDQCYQNMSSILAPEQVEMIKQQIESIAGNQANLIDAILYHRHDLLFQPNGVNNLVARIVARQLRSSANAELSDFVEADFYNLFSNRQSLSKSLDDYKKIAEKIDLKTQPGIITEMSKLRRLLEVGQVLDDQVLQINELMNLLFELPQQKDNPLRKALVDIYMLDQAAFVVSERLVKRFAATFSRAKKDITYQKLELGVANIIGEFILVGMGVISPDVFRVMTGQNNLDPEDKLIMNNNEVKSVRQLTEKYNLHTGKFFYSRFATLMVKPSQQTDNLIRDFITKNVRQVKTELCQAIGLQQIIDNFLGTFQDDGEEVANDALMTDIFNALGYADFKLMVAAIINDKLLPDLVKMVSASKHLLPIK